MFRTKIIAFMAGILSLAALSTFGQKPAAGGTPGFMAGPTNAPLGKVAQVAVPAGYVFLDGKATRAMMKARGEPTSGHELGLLSGTNAEWAVFFEFAEVGYVKDDEKDRLNPDELLARIRRGTDEANKARQRAGNPPLEIVGWEIKPQYDPATHNLEWAIRATCQGDPVLNYNTKLLGRKGVMEIILVVSPDKLSATLPEFRKLLAGYSFGTGNTYAEYRTGDKVAAYGLGALVVGGAAVGAAKLGLFTGLAVLFKKLWKLLILAFAAVATFFKKLFSRRRPNAPQA